MADEHNLEFKIDNFFNHGVDLKTRTIYMGSCSEDENGESGTDFRMAERIIKSLHLIKAHSKSRATINIIMNNIGGDESHGFAIFDAIRSVKLPVNITVLGNACSMGSIILQAANKRIISRHAVMLLHYGEITISGHSLNTERAIAFQRRLNSVMESIYLERIRVKHPSFNLKQLQEMIKLDCWLSAEEALELGLVDEII